MPALIRAGERARTATLLGIGLAILVVSHAGLYLFLTGDARAGLADIEAEIPPARLASARPPGPTPAAGSSGYSPWLRDYEAWHGAQAYELHARHEGMLRWGMLLSFLVGTGCLVAGLARSAPQRRRRGERVVAPHVARVVPLRAAAPVVAPRRVRRSA